MDAFAILLEKVKLLLEDKELSYVEKENLFAELIIFYVTTLKSGRNYTLRSCLLRCFTFKMTVQLCSFQNLNDIEQRILFRWGKGNHRYYVVNF